MVNQLVPRSVTEKQWSPSYHAVVTSERQLGCTVLLVTTVEPPSEIGPVYNRPFYNLNGHCLRFQVFTLPVHLQPFEKRTTPLQQVNLYCPQCVPCSEIPLHVTSQRGLLESLQMIIKATYINASTLDIHQMTTTSRFCLQLQVCIWQSEAKL